MQNNLTVKELIDNISDSSRSPVKNIYDLSVIIETSLAYKKHEEFKDLIFTAKYVNGLKKVLANKTINQDKYMEKMFAEFNKNLQKVIELMKNIVEGASESENKFFNEKYFSMNHESIVNTMDFIGDLSFCKEYFNIYPDAVPEITFRHSS